MTAGRYDQEAISHAIHTKWAGQTVHFVKETDSTNNLAKKLAAEGAPHGTLVAAEYQTAGKGRLGRSWTVPAGSSVMMTIVLRPEFAPKDASMLTLVMGLSVAQAVKRLGADASIKWPNDVVVSRKKICGILTEMAAEGDTIRHVVIGTGVNVNLEEMPPEIRDKATSLLIETGQRYDRARLIGLLMEEFERNYERFAQTCDLRLLLEDYHALLANYGKQVRVLDSRSPYEGIARGINERGELLVERTDGETVRVNAGEVSVRGLYSYV